MAVVAHPGPIWLLAGGKAGTHGVVAAGELGVEEGRPAGGTVLLRWQQHPSHQQHPQNVGLAARAAR